MTKSSDRQPSSMVAEFRAKEDLKQACYEATLDLNLYIAHLENIAKRAEKNFPEVAAGLRGTASGIAQHLRGVDGDWRTSSTEELRRVLSGDKFEAHMWAYEFCRDPRMAVVLIGNCVAIAAAKPGLTFWEVLAMSRAKLADLQPLIEQLLASSPLRKPQ